MIHKENTKLIIGHHTRFIDGSTLPPDFLFRIIISIYSNLTCLMRNSSQWKLWNAAAAAYYYNTYYSYNLDKQVCYMYRLIYEMSDASGNFNNTIFQKCVHSFRLLILNQFCVHLLGDVYFITNSNLRCNERHRRFCKFTETIIQFRLRHKETWKIVRVANEPVWSFDFLFFAQL